MTLLAVTQPLLDELALELAPRVAEITGWPLDMEGCILRPISKEQTYEETVLDQLETLGLVRPSDRAGLTKRIVEYVIEAQTLGCYQYWDGEILIVRENVDESNLDGLKLVLGHELTHRAQHVAHPELFAQLEALLRRYYADEEQQVMAKLQPIMALLESHATYVQETLRRQFYPQARVESHCNLVTILEWAMGKLTGNKYTERLSEVAEAARAGRMDALFGA